jgi:hypothetical protein
MGTRLYVAEPMKLEPVANGDGRLMTPKWRISIVVAFDKENVFKPTRS